MDITSDMSTPPNEEEEDVQEIYPQDDTIFRYPQNDQTYHPEINKGGRVKMTPEDYAKLGKRKGSKSKVRKSTVTNYVNSTSDIRGSPMTHSLRKQRKNPNVNSMAQDFNTLQTNSKSSVSLKKSAVLNNSSLYKPIMTEKSPIKKTKITSKKYVDSV